MGVDLVQTVEQTDMLHHWVDAASYDVICTFADDCVRELDAY